MQDVRRSPEYQRWRQEVRRHDGNACRICGVQRNLHIHHIKPLERYPEFATELDNGITLCGNCHTFLSGKEENTNLQTIIDAITGRHDTQTANQLNQLSVKLLVSWQSMLKTCDSNTKNCVVYQLFAQLQTYPESLDQFLPLVSQILNSEDGAREGLSKQIMVEFLKAYPSREASQILADYEHQARAERGTITRIPIAVLDGHEVLSVAFSPDGRTVASGSRSGEVKLWAVTTAENVATLRGNAGEIVSSVAFSPDGYILASGSEEGTVNLWEVATRHNIANFEGHRGAVESLAYSPDGKILASASEDETIKLWSIATQENTMLLKGHKEQVSSVAFSPDGEVIASGSWDATVKLWDVDSGENIGTLGGRTGPIESVAYSPDGETLASGTCDGTIELCALSTGESIGTLKGHFGSVESVTYSPDGQSLASGGGFEDRTVKLWVRPYGKSVATLEAHTGPVESLAYSPDGKCLATGGGYPDGTVKLWDVSWLHGVSQRLLG